MSYKIFTQNVELMPRETKVVKFPWGYFKRSPTVNLSSTTNVIISIEELNKNYFVITNPTNIRIIVSYSATLKRDQKVLIVYSDIDGDNIPDYLDSDIDGDGFTNDQEISAGSDPYDSSSLPAPVNPSLYIGLATPLLTGTFPLLSFYSGEMNDLTYPNLINLQPDSSGKTQYKIISNPNSEPDAIEPQRIKNLIQSSYNNTNPASSIIRVDNLERNKTYNIFSIAEYDNFNVPQISATFKASNSSDEDPHTFLGNIDISSYTNLMNFVNTNVNDFQYWIHNVSIDNSNQVTFTEGSQKDAEFVFSSMAFMQMHTKYSANSNGTNPVIEIAIQQADFDGSDDGSSNFAGYLNNFNYSVEEVNGVTPIKTDTVNNYTALSATLNKDLNLENHARVSVGYISPRMRFRMHVKLLSGGDFDFQLALNVNSMMNFSDLDTYNTDYNINSNLNYYSIIPNDGNTGARVYYHYFTIREDGFIIWENNLTIND